MEKRMDELEKELESVCGIYENDCSQCPKREECSEYIRLGILKKEPERQNMTALEIRYQNAIEKIGGAAGLLNLPEQVKNVLKNTTDLKAKVKILEEIAKIV